MSKWSNACVMVASTMCAAASILAAEPMPAAGAANANDVATIEKLSQQFSDASAVGDGATLARLADDRILFMNETGELAAKKDLASNTPPPTGVVNQLVQSDVRVEMHGDTAVTSFTDNLTSTANGNVRTASFLSTEVWQKAHGEWRMISSQTLTKAKEPVATTLDATTLDDYVGTYAASGISVAITRKDAGLESATNGGTAAPLAMEVRDVAFTPGQPRLRRVFIREGGKVVGFLSIRETGDLMFKRT
jgi:ketosteroid isomerase-like protein